MSTFGQQLLEALLGSESKQERKPLPPFKRVMSSLKDAITNVRPGEITAIRNFQILSLSETDNEVTFHAEPNPEVIERCTEGPNGEPCNKCKEKLPKFVRERLNKALQNILVPGNAIDADRHLLLIDLDESTWTWKVRRHRLTDEEDTVLNEQSKLLGNNSIYDHIQRLVTEKREAKNPSQFRTVVGKGLDPTTYILRDQDFAQVGNIHIEGSTLLAWSRLALFITKSSGRQRASLRVLSSTQPEWVTVQLDVGGEIFSAPGELDKAVEEVAKIANSTLKGIDC